MQIPEVRGLTKEILDRLEEVGDIEYIRRKNWIVKNINDYVVVSSYDIAVVVSELVKINSKLRNMKKRKWKDK